MFSPLTLFRRGILLLVAAILAYLFLPAIGSISPDALTLSIAREVDGGIEDPCKRKNGSRWACVMWDSGESGSARYRLRLHGNCWQATTDDTKTTESVFPARASGCVKLRDQLRPADRLFDLLLRLIGV